MKKLIAFDLDGTLAESKAAIDDMEMAERLAVLLTVGKVAIISGGDWPQFEIQVLGTSAQKSEAEKSYRYFPPAAQNFTSMVKSGKNSMPRTLLMRRKKKIISCLEDAVDKSGFKAKKTWGETIEDRGSQITYSASWPGSAIERKKEVGP